MKYEIHWMYKKNGKEIQFISDFVEEEQAIQFGEEFNGRNITSSLQFKDEMGTTWTLKELKKLAEKIEEEPHDVIVYFDGGFNKATYEGGIGVVIYYKKGKKQYRLRANERIDELDTNNEVEYAALYYALQQLEQLGVKQQPCEIKGDSKVVLKQLEGEWPCFEENLNRWLDRIEEKIEQLNLLPKYFPISRNENKEADQLASQALTGKNIYSEKEMD